MLPNITQKILQTKILAPKPAQAGAKFEMKVVREIASKKMILEM